MSGIFWKEVRENFLWAVLGMAGFGIALAYAWSTVTNSQFNNQDYLSILSPSFLMVTTFGAPILGMALGFLQIMPERLRDRWAFLIHRPVTPGRIFWGKAAAGLTLYFPAVLIPFLLACWNASRTGVVGGPFDWAMVRPGLVDIFCGAVFYFGALLTALREARWFGSKAFGLLAALGCSAACSQQWITMELSRTAIVAGLLLLPVAAWGAFGANGAFRPQSRLAKAALALVLFFGTLELFNLMISLAGMTQHQRFWEGQQYAIDLQGRILRIKYKNGQLDSAIDLQNNPVPLTPDMKERNDKWRAREGYLQQLHDLFPKRPWDYGQYRQFQNYFSYPQDVQGARWFYAPKEGLYFGYQRDNRKLEWIGGSDSFVHPDQTRPQSFGSPHSVSSMGNIPLLIKKDAVYSIDFVQPQTLPLWTPQDGEKLVAAGLMQFDSYSEFANWVCFVQTEKQVLGMTMKGVPLFEAAVPSFDKSYVSGTAFFIPQNNRFFIEYVPDYQKYNSGERNKMPSYMQEIDAKGATVTMTEIPTIPNQEYQRPWTKYLDFLTYQSWGPIWGTASMWFQFVMGDPDTNISPHWIRTHPKKYLKGQFFYFLPSVATGLIAAGIAAWVLRRREMWERGRWGLLALVFLGGLAGLVALLFWFDWPRVEACPACGKRRRTDLEACPGCGAGWPEPVRDGTEILTFRGGNS